PGTSWALWIETCLPSRSTLQLAAVMVCRASMAASALLSWKTPSTAFSSTTIRMIKTSAKLSPEMKLVTAETAAAIIRMMSMGSFSCSMKRWSRVGFSASFSLLGPSFSSRAAASALLRPSALVFSSALSSWWACTYSCFICRFTPPDSVQCDGARAPSRCGHAKEKTHALDGFPVRESHSPFDQAARNLWEEDRPDGQAARSHAELLPHVSSIIEDGGTFVNGQFRTSVKQTGPARREKAPAQPFTPR